MLRMHFSAILMLASKNGAMHWLISLGGLGLVLVGLADNSLIPLPGSNDVATVVLAAHHRQPWFYYSAMATVGAVIGGYLTYRMARKGGKEAVNKKFSQKKAKRFYAIFERWGFASVAIPAILPPPFPIVPILIVAGAMQYPTKKFIGALTLGRGIRYAILGYLGAHYGSSILKFFGKYYWPVLITLVALSVITGLYGVFEYKRRQKAEGSTAPEPGPVRRQPA